MRSFKFPLIVLSVVFDCTLMYWVEEVAAETR